MKILYFTPSLYNCGGTERVLSLKANYLAGINGFEVVIVTTDQKHRKPFFDLDNRIKLYDLDINYCDDTSLPLLKMYQVRKKKNSLYKMRLLNLVLEESPDVCVSLFGKEFDFLPDLNLPCKIVAELHFNKMFRQHTYLSIHKGFLWKFIAKFRTFQLVQTSQKYDRIVVLTKEDLAEWNKTNHNVIQIYNPLPYEDSVISNLNYKSLISVGRLSSEKNYESLISAWNYVYCKHPDWKINIWGDGELKSNLKKLISDNNLEDSICLCGKTNSIDKEYLKNSAFVMTSKYEGFPMVLLEASSFGLPLISYDCYCGPKDIIDDGKNGFLVPFANERALADAICEIIENPSARASMGFAAREKSLEFSQEKILPKWPKFFNSL